MLKAEMKWLDAVKRNEDNYYGYTIRVRDIDDAILNIDTEVLNRLYRQNEMFGQHEILRATNTNQVLVNTLQGTNWVDPTQYQAQANHQQHIQAHQMMMQGVQQQAQWNHMNDIFPGDLATAELMQAGLITPDEYRDMFRYTAMQPILNDIQEPNLDEPFEDEGDDQHD